MHLDAAQVVEELAGAAFKDPRLCRRLRGLAERFVAEPEKSFPRQMKSSAELEAAYRFFGNTVVSPETILSGHYESVRTRCEREGAVLAIHDSTTITFRGDGRRTASDVALAKQRFFAHVALVIADDSNRRPLGIAGLEVWHRGEENLEEYGRWWRVVQVVSKRLSAANVVHIMDREADDYLLFHHLIENRHRFIVRTRAINGHSRLLADGELTRLDQALASLDVVVQRDVKLAERRKKSSKLHDHIHPPRDSRLTTLNVAAMAVPIRRPKRHPSQTAARRAMDLPPSLAINVVRVWEPSPPPGEKPVEWVLFTNEPIENAAQILHVVDRYRARWTIEEYFKALKSGCAFESRQLEDFDALANALAIFAPIACTLLDLRSESRRAPDAPTELPAAQLEVLRAMGRVRLPQHPTQREVLLAIAAIGGHIKYNGDPGWLTLSRGYADLLLLTAGWEAAKLQQARDQ
jgi:hypothetical protein